MRAPTYHLICDVMARKPGVPPHQAHLAFGPKATSITLVPGRLTARTWALTLQLFHSHDLPGRTLAPSEISFESEVLNGGYTLRESRIDAHHLGAMDKSG
jgi:hypothetical protein